MSKLCIIPARALSDPRLTHRDLRALLAVGMYTNHAGKGVWASQTTMAERALMTRPQMNESLARLEEYGYIIKTRRRNANGAETTCLIDVLLDETPVPDSGTPPVPKTGTPPVPKTGTQTMVVTDPSTDDDTARNIPEQYRPAYDTVMTQARFPAAVKAELVALHNGQHGTFGWEVIGRALHDMTVSGASITPRSLRAFCEGVATSATPATSLPTPKKRGVDFSALAAKLSEEPSTHGGTDGVLRKGPETGS